MNWQKAYLCVSTTLPQFENVIVYLPYATRHSLKISLPESCSYPYIRFSSPITSWNSFFGGKTLSLNHSDVTFFVSTDIDEGEVKNGYSAIKNSFQLTLTQSRREVIVLEQHHHQQPLWAFHTLLTTLHLELSLNRQIA